MTDKTAGQRQQEHYDVILDDYARHYYDEWSNRYRERFYFDPLLEGMTLAGKRVADVACGNGENSLALLNRFPTADIVGLDVSTAACQAYRANTGRQAFEVDITAPVALPAPVDVAIVVGGLHHCVQNLDAAVETLGRLVKPGGTALLVEPSARFFLNTARRFWYRHDRYFDAETEEALDYNSLVSKARPWFRPQFVQHMGGAGYLLIINSLLWRMPPGVKRWIAPPLSAADALYNHLPGRWPFGYFVTRWERRA